jgi:ADP-heptose:LPS heptosyltransferase
LKKILFLLEHFYFLIYFSKFLFLLRDILFKLLNVRTASYKYIIVRPGGLGDLVCLTKSMKILGTPPDSCLFIIERRSEVWAKHLTLKYLCYDNSTDLKEILKSRGEVYINSEQYYGLSNIIYYFTGSYKSKETIGFVTNKSASLYSTKIDYNPKFTSEVTEFTKLFLSTHVNSPLNSGASARGTTNTSNPPIVALSGTLEPTRNVGAKLWIKLIDECLPLGSFRLVFTDAESKLGESLLIHYSNRAIFKKASFNELMEVLKQTQLVVTMDGGFVHIASYYDIKTYAMFTSGDHIKWQPGKTGSKIFKNFAVPCSPCVMFGKVPPCSNRLICWKIDFNNPKEV